MTVCGRIPWRSPAYTGAGVCAIYFGIAKNDRCKSVWSLFQRKRLNNQTVWTVIFGLTGPICARALKSFYPLELRTRGIMIGQVSQRSDSFAAQTGSYDKRLLLTARVPVG